jgi:hypothetical protein
MYGKCIIVAIALCLTCSSQKQPEPYSVKADKLGESLDAWRANNPHVDVCDNNTLDSRLGSAADPDVVYCLARAGEEQTFATAPLTGITAWFFKGQLFRLEMDVWNRNWSDTVLLALIDKYGAPKVEEVPLENGFGARFSMSIYTWKNEVSTIVTLDAFNKGVTNRTKQAAQKKARSDM